MSGCAIGYISYDCARCFEPRTQRPLIDILQVPKAYLMLCDTIIAYNHFFQRFQIVHSIDIKETSLQEGYSMAKEIIFIIVQTLNDVTNSITNPDQPPQ